MWFVVYIYKIAHIDGFGDWFFFFPYHGLIISKNQGPTVNLGYTTVDFQKYLAKFLFQTEEETQSGDWRNLIKSGC